MNKKMENIKKFIDDNNTVFTKGPFEVDGKTYDYKLQDSDGTDYCTLDQIKEWQVKPIKVIE
jgi:hypothetical protein